MAATVLVVEDEPKLRDLVRAYLEHDGVGVLSTGSGAEAIALAAQAGPDLIVLDLRLPDVSGREVARQRRETTAAVVASAAMAYRNAGGWIHADLESAVALAGEAGASVAVFDANQGLAHAALRPTTGSQEGPGSITQARGSTAETPSGPIITTPVTVGGHDVGHVTVRFPSIESAGVVSLRSHLVRAVGVGAGLAALLAVAVALVVSRRITRPVAALTRVVRAWESGDREARVGKVKAAGELAELAAARGSSTGW